MIDVAVPTLSQWDMKLKPILRDLNSSSQHIHACSVLTRDGISLSSVLDQGIDPHRLAAMASSLLSLAQTAADELKQGELKQVLIEGEDGYLLTVGAGENAVLSVMAEKSVNLGMVFIEARRTVAAIKEAL